MNRNLTDQQRVAVAKAEYQLLNPGDEIQVDHQRFGKVVNHLYTDDGFQMYVIENRPQAEYTLLFKGSSGLLKGNPETWSNEWLATNFPIGWALLFQRNAVPSQLKTAARELNRVLKRNPAARFYLYGHSLGAINIQYALSHCRHLGQVKRADIYEGPNMFWLLNQRERKHVRKFKHKVHNYVDVYDPITVAYVDGRHLVGKLHYVNSKRLPPITQHMWGGYTFDDHGRLRTRPLDAVFIKRAQLGQRWMKSGHELYQEHVNLRQQRQITTFRDWLQQALDKYVPKESNDEIPTAVTLREWLAML